MPIRPLCWCYDRKGYCYCMRFYTYHRGDCGPCFNPARAAFHHAHSRSPAGVTGPFQWRIARGALCVLLCQYVLSTRTATSQLASPTSTCLCLRFIWLLPLGAKYSAVPRIVHVLNQTRNPTDIPIPRGPFPFPGSVSLVALGLVVVVAARAGLVGGCGCGCCCWRWAGWRLWVLVLALGWLAVGSALGST